MYMYMYIIARPYNTLTISCVHWILQSVKQRTKKRKKERERETCACLYMYMYMFLVGVLHVHVVMCVRVCGMSISD